MTVSRYFIITISIKDNVFSFQLDKNFFRYGVGQVEQGENGFLHWQIYVNTCKPQRISAVQKHLPKGIHIEVTRSNKAEEYCQKDKSRIDGPYKFGEKPIQRNDPKDWETVLSSAKAGEFASIPADIVIRCYGNLKRIASDNMVPIPIERQIHCFIGKTGTGKSRRAWDEVLTQLLNSIFPNPNPNPRPGWIRTLKIRGQNSGTVIKAINTWSWMNSAGQSMSHTSCVGLIDTQFASKSKDQVVCYELKLFG